MAGRLRPGALCPATPLLARPSAESVLPHKGGRGIAPEGVAALRRCFSPSGSVSARAPAGLAGAADAFVRRGAALDRAGGFRVVAGAKGLGPLLILLDEAEQLPLEGALAEHAGRRAVAEVLLGGQRRRRRGEGEGQAERKNKRFHGRLST